MKSKYKKVLTKEFLVKEYVENKKSSNKIAEEVGCSKGTVSYNLKKCNVIIRSVSERQNPNSNADSILTKDYLMEKYVNKKLSLKKIAKLVDCAQVTISRKMIHFQITRRNLKEARLEHSGEKAPNYNTERHKTHYCKESTCDNEITYNTWKIGGGRCASCAIKKLCIIPENCTMFGKSMSKETKRKLSLAKGGTGIPYENDEYSAEFYIIRPKILKRDSFTCQGKNCTITQEEQFKDYNCSLHVHHIDHNKNNCSKFNLISLCSVCHGKAHSPKDKQHWIDYYQYKIKEIYQNLNTNNQQILF